MLTLKLDPIQYPSKQFGIWRILFGLFLTFYYVRLFPFATELFSNKGALANFPAIMSARTTFYPSWILAWDSPVLVKAILIACILLSVCIMIGLRRRASAFALWILIMWLYNRNLYADSPDYCFVNWLVFILAFIPEGEKYAVRSEDPNWKMPQSFYWAAWIIISVGYMYAGTSKFKSGDSTWRNGMAMYYVLTTDTGRLSWYGSFFDNFPYAFFAATTWGVLFFQTTSPFIVPFRSLRLWWWLVITSMQLGILMFVNLPEVTLGMLLFHGLLWDPAWINQLKESREFLARTSTRFLGKVFLPPKAAGPQGQSPS